MMAKPIKTLKLHYPMIKFLIMGINPGRGGGGELLPYVCAAPNGMFFTPFGLKL